MGVVPVTAHRQNCVDDQGKVECVCGAPTNGLHACKCGDDSNADLIHGRFVCRPPATLTESLNIDWINERRRQLGHEQSDPETEDS